MTFWRRCGLLSNYFDLVLITKTIIVIIIFFIALKMAYIKQENSENKNATGTGQKLTAYAMAFP